MSELPTNSEIENAAIACVIAREHAAGRQAVDVRYRGEPADIRSPPRHIEVKAYGTTVRGYELWLEAGQVEEARQNPEFYVYVVENVRQGDHRSFTLKVLGSPHLQQLLQRAKEQHDYTVAWPVAAYDRTRDVV